MNGIHDVGGMDGFGKVFAEEEELLFHEEWERRAFGLLNGALGQGFFNLDEMRHGIERMNPADYLTSGYYGHWTATLAKLLVEKGMIDEAELDRRTQAYQNESNKEVPRREDPDLVEHMKQVIKFGASTVRELSVPPKFEVGSRIKTINYNPSGHTRLPRYARGKHGIIHAVYDPHVFPDTHAHGQGESPEYLYSVRLTVDELWGVNEQGAVHIDLWESYLIPVNE